MTSSEEVCISQRLLYCWDSIFDTPPRVGDRHDEPYVNVGDEGTVNPSIDLIHFFMQAFDRNENSRSATDTVVDFCAGADLLNLQRDESATTELVALLNDSGGMTARDLFHALTQPRNARIKRSQELERGDSFISHPTVRIDEMDKRINRL